MKLNDLSHDYIARLLKAQRKIFDGVVEDGATRIRRVADAGNLKEFWDKQRELFPSTRDRIAGNVKETLDILSGTRDGLQALIENTVLEFKGKKTRQATTKPRATKKKTTVGKAKPAASEEKAA